MNSLNRVELIGRITRDVELRYSQRGNAFATVGLALQRWEKAEDGGREATDFLDLVAFGNLAERLPQFTSKGAVVYIEGKLRQRQAQDSGQRQLQVLLDQVELLASGKQPPPEPQSRPAGVREPEPVTEVDPDDIPF